MGKIKDNSPNLVAQIEPDLLILFKQQPNWVAWFAQDKNGTWWGFEVEPLQNHQGWYENEVGQYIKIFMGKENPSWKNSLISRKILI